MLRSKLTAGASLTNDLEVHDWQGRDCDHCKGYGELDDQASGRLACVHCAGTGEAYGFVCMGPTIGEVVNNVVAFPSRRVAPSSGDLSSITLESAFAWAETVLTWAVENHDLMRALLRGDAIIIPKGSINA
jgi:hypothetical protein